MFPDRPRLPRISSGCCIMMLKYIPYHEAHIISYWRLILNNLKAATMDD